MISQKVYALRRELVAALAGFDGPQNLDTLLRCARVRLLRPDPVEAREAWEYLASRGYTVPVVGYGGEVAKLEPAVRLTVQATGRAPLDEALWGPEVL